MKKLFFGILAMAAMAACATDETVVAPKGEAIEFGAFVDNVTKAIDPSYNDSNKISEIYVYGTVTGSNNTPVSIFEHTRVYADGAGYNEDWKCDVTQYWVAGADYQFAAVAGVAKTDVTCPNGIPSSIAFTSNGTTDLVYGTAAVNNANATGNATVAFDMAHLLAKVKFTVENTTNKGFEDKNSAYYYKISNVRIANAYTAGTVAVPAKTWTVSGAPGAVVLGNVTNIAEESAAATAIADRAVVTSNYERLLIPYNYTTTKLQVKFNIQLCLNDDSNIINTETDKTVEVPVNIECGKSYNFKLEVSVGQEIKFTVKTLDEWGGDIENEAEGDVNNVENSQN